MQQTKYTKSGDVNIAYQVVGDGPLDIVVVWGWASHVEHYREEPSFERFIQRLASFSRVIMFDKRGTGLSDRVSSNELPPLETRMDDVRAVMAAAGSPRAAIMGVSEGGPMSALFAATYPEQTTALVLFGTFANGSAELFGTQYETIKEQIQSGWGQGRAAPMFAPSRANDPSFVKWFAQLDRLGTSPGGALSLLAMNKEIDIRPVLPTIRVPTLVIHRAGDRVIPIESGRYLARKIPGAKFVELSGDDHLPAVGNADAVLSEIQEFLTGARPEPEPDRILATILYTDIVGSTDLASELGDGRWKELLEDYYVLAREELTSFRGREVKTTGDGVLATFDGPARGVRCAHSIMRRALDIGVETRAGLHTGECEIIGEDIGGIAAHIGARVAAEASSGQVLTSRTVKDLVAGSGLQFDDLGDYRLKGVPDEWRLFAVREPA